MRIPTLLLPAAIVAAMSWSVPATAQEPTNAELKKDIERLSDGLKAMQKDLQDIKAMLQRGAAPAGAQNVVTIDLANSPVKGDTGAKVTLVEYSDYQCPFCARHVRETAPQLDKEYIQTGKVRHAFLDLPLESIHKSAFKAAEAARCAGDQGRFWEMHDRLFANQKALEPWMPHAEAIGLDAAKFEACMTSAKWAPEIRSRIAQAQAFGISGTPGFYLALTDPTSTKVKTVKFLRGAVPYDTFKTEIDKLLEPAKTVSAAQE
jgi:protein-disulfide isomerase